MQTIDPRIIRFIREHHVLTLATCVESEPYCANLFFVYMEAENVLVVTSEEKTKHINDALLNNKVAGSIVLETETIGLIRGLQFQGVLFRPEGELKRKAKQCYLQRFPYAILKNAAFWTLRPAYFKFTDNRLGFGKKIIVTL